MKKFNLLIGLCLMVFLLTPRLSRAQTRNPQTAIVPTTETTDEEDELKKRERMFLSVTVDENGNSYSSAFWWAPSRRLSSTGKIYLGLSLSSTFSSKPQGNVIYPFLGYKLPLDAKKNFNIWGNAGYYYSITGAYKSIPSSSSGDFSWQAGADIFFSQNIGITAHTTEGKLAWFGIVIR
jgi:hypothetical protein